MTDYLTEQEQVQQLKNWVKQYGFTVLFGIIIALLATSGWRYWQNYRNQILQHASILYDDMVIQRAQTNDKDAIAKANKLLTDYKNTPYADMAALMLGRYAALKKDYIEAAKQFNWVIEHSKNASIREIGRIRLARVMITEKKSEAALSLLDTIDDNTFIGLIDEVRGDAYLSQKDSSAARNSYQLALQELPNAEVNRPLLAMKLDNLATGTL